MHASFVNKKKTLATYAYLLRVRPIGKLALVKGYSSCDCPSVRRVRRVLRRFLFSRAKVHLLPFHQIAGGQKIEEINRK